MSNNSLEFLKPAQFEIMWGVYRYPDTECCISPISWFCPIFLKFGLRILEFWKIIKRGNNFAIEVCIQERSFVIITIGALGFCCKYGSKEPSVSPPFDSSLVILTEALAASRWYWGILRKWNFEIHKPDLVTTFCCISDRGRCSSSYEE